MRALTAHLCWLSVQHTFTAVRLALRAGRCGATWFSFTAAPRRSSKDSGRAGAAGPMKWQDRWGWANAPRGNWPNTGKTETVVLQHSPRGWRRHRETGDEHS